MLRRLLPPSLLLVIASIAYSSAGHRELLFDSGQGNIDNPRITSLSEAKRAFWHSPWRPGQAFADLSFAWNCAVNRVLGLDDCHVNSLLVGNVLIHAANAFLVYLLILSLSHHFDGEFRLTPRVALVSAILFAVHPLHVASVAYIIQRRGLLVTMFSLLGLLSYLRARKPRRVATVSPLGRTIWRESADGCARSDRGRRVALSALVLVFYWLAFRSKAVGIIFPCFLGLYEFCRMAAGPWSGRRLAIWLTISSLALIWVIVGGLWWEHAAEPLGIVSSPWNAQNLWGPWPHFLTGVRAFYQYLKLLVLPLPAWTCIDHTFSISSHFLNADVLLAILLNGGLVGVAFLAIFRRHTLTGMGILWFYIALMPYALIPQPQLFVEYRTYLANVGLVLAVASFSRLTPSGRERVPSAVVAAVATVFLLLTIRQNQRFHDGVSLWGDVVSKYPNAARGHVNLAAALADGGDLDAAVYHFDRALELAPESWSARAGLGFILEAKGREQEAIQRYLGALDLTPDPTDRVKAEWRLRTSLAHLLLKHERFAEAERHYTAALALDTNSVEIRTNLGNVALALGDSSRATRLYTEALALASSDMQVWTNLGRALESGGRIGDAIATYQSALAARPDYAPAHHALGVALAQQNRPGEALTHLKEAVRIDPQYAAAHYDLGTVLDDLGEIERAIKEYERALALKGDDVNALNNLAGGLIALGRNEEGLARYYEALARKWDDARLHTNLGVALENQGELDQAMRHYFEALWIAPEHRQAENGLGIVFSGRGDVLAGTKFFESALTHDPEYIDARLNLGTLLQSLGDTEEAALHFCEAATRAPGSYSSGVGRNPVPPQTSESGGERD